MVTVIHRMMTDRTIATVLKSPEYFFFFLTVTVEYTCTSQTALRSFYLFLVIIIDEEM